jgi:preprotein translocase subunit YajC
MLAHLLLLADQAPENQGGNPLGMLLPLMLIFAAFYFLLILPKRRQEKREREALFTQLKKNDEVVTYSGIIGIVAQIKDNDEVVLKVDESSNVRLRVLKSTIMRVLSPKDATKDAAPAAAPAATGDNVKAK